MPIYKISIPFAEKHINIHSERKDYIALLNNNYKISKHNYKNPAWNIILQNNKNTEINLSARIAYFGLDTNLDLNSLPIIIRHFIASLMITSNYLCFHASAVNNNENGYMFVGPQKAGKTTISNLMGNKVSDDFTIVNLNKTPFMIYASAFEKHKVKKPAPNPVSLTGIYFLKKSKNNHKKQISSINKLNYLSQNIYSYFVFQPNTKRVDKTTSLQDIIFKKTNSKKLKSNLVKTSRYQEFLLIKLLKNIGIYRLFFNLNVTFADIL